MFISIYLCKSHKRGKKAQTRRLVVCSRQMSHTACAQCLALLCLVCISQLSLAKKNLSWLAFFAPFSLVPV